MKEPQCTLLSLCNHQNYLLFVASIQVPGSQGNRFVLTFPADPPNERNIELTISTKVVGDVNVTVTTPVGVRPTFTESFTVSWNSSKTLILPATLRIRGPGRNSKAVVVSSSDAVHVSTNNKGSCAAYLNLPRSSLGTDYYALTWWADTPSGTAHIIIAAGRAQRTAIRITFPVRMGGVVIHGDTRYGPGERLEEFLGPYESFQLQERFDLSGTRVESDTPISVLGGNVDTQIGTGTFTDNVMSELPPTHTWGTVFIALPVPEDKFGGYVKFVAREDDTIVRVNGKVTQRVLNRGEFHVQEVSPTAHTLIESNEPIMAVYFTKGDDAIEGDGAPSSLLLPPTAQFLNDYPFTTFTDDISTYTNFLMLVIRKSALSGLILDDVPVDTDGWIDVSSTSPLMVAKCLRLTERSKGQHQVRHVMPDVTFGAYVYGAAKRDCAYAFPAGMNLRNLTRSHQVRRQHLMYPQRLPTI